MVAPRFSHVQSRQAAVHFGVKLRYHGRLRELKDELTIVTTYELK